MKRTLLSILFCCLMAAGVYAQNLVTNPGFEAEASTFTVVEGTTNVLRRTNNSFWDVVTQTANPTSTAETITAGMWVRKSSSTSYVKGVLTTADFKSGAACMNLKITAGYTGTGFDLVSNARCVNFQKLTTSLSNTKKYVASVWAKVDATANNQCTDLTFYITDNTAKSIKYTTIPLTGGTTWTKYQTTIDIPAWISTHSTADFSTAYFGVGIVTIYDATPKTLYSGILLDDVSLTEDNSTTAIETASAYKLTVSGKSILANEAGTFDVYSLQGAKVYQHINATVAETGLQAGIYILKFTHANGKQTIQKIRID